MSSPSSKNATGTATVAATIAATDDTVIAASTASTASTHQYYAMVIDSGPIIKQQGLQQLMTSNHALHYVTVPGVMAEIRDNKARQFLQHNLLFLLDSIQIKTPSAESMQAIVQFAKQTGDYPSLSMVDLQVLALAYEMEQEGCGCHNIRHVRTTPKRKVGLGNIQLLNANNNNKNHHNASAAATGGAGKNKEEEEEDEKKKKDAMASNDTSASATAKPLNIEYDLVEDDDDEEEEEKGDDESDDSDSDSDDDNDEPEELSSNANEKELQQDNKSTNAPTASTTTTTNDNNNNKTGAPKSWATLLGGSAKINVNDAAAAAAGATTASTPTPDVVVVADKNLHVTFGSMKLGKSATHNDNDGGQFDDASDDDNDDKQDFTVKQELELEFPSLSAAAMVPYEGEDDDDDDDNVVENDKHESIPQDDSQKQQDAANTTASNLFERSDQEKRKNLQPVSKSGKLYNSFRKYGDLMKPKPAVKQGASEPTQQETNQDSDATTQESIHSNSNNKNKKPQQESKIMGNGMSAMAETMKFEEDDGEGWITSAQDIKIMKTHLGQLDPTKTPESALSGKTDSNTAGPPLSQRTACVTTDFAMQNVLLQMNLILLSVDGMRIRRLKSWVLRCGACFKIHSADEGFLNGRMKRLFCSHCGSDMLQRISASVDGKTGRLKLHFSRRKQGRHMSTRGTKYSLPKPGKGNKYQGDLLLREDQLLMGAWNQKVKIRAGNTYQKSNSESIFGRDLASTVGCNVTKSGVGGGGFGSNSWAASTESSGPTSNTATSNLDIRVGFGARKNPNAAKGRERRGKKKKSTDRACGMRRY
jgi:RNA-binding protein NOB1